MRAWVASLPWSLSLVLLFFPLSFSCPFFYFPCPSFKRDNTLRIGFVVVFFPASLHFQHKTHHHRETEPHHLPTQCFPPSVFVFCFAEREKNTQKKRKKQFICSCAAACPCHGKCSNQTCATRRALAARASATPGVSISVTATPVSTDAVYAAMMVAGYTATPCAASTTKQLRTRAIRVRTSAEIRGVVRGAAAAPSSPVCPATTSSADG